MDDRVGRVTREKFAAKLPGSETAPGEVPPLGKLPPGTRGTDATPGSGTASFQPLPDRANFA
eukprot:7510180-Prorocentrum_lima.AAC.1